MPGRKVYREMVWLVRHSDAFFEMIVDRDVYCRVSLYDVR
jgi:hypothetical protein